MTKQQINAIAMSLNFPFDHSKGEVKDLERLVRLVERVKSEPQKPCHPTVHWRLLQFNGGRPISQTRIFANKVREG